MAIRRMYHTQEHRMEEGLLTKPILCERDDAWLGTAYYFWLDRTDAERWGDKSKTKTSRYDVYEGDIDCENVLNTVFDEEQYNFWLASIEAVTKKIMKKTNRKPTLKTLNNYLIERGHWDEVDGILFQDLPTNDYYSLIEPIKTRKGKLVYFPHKKRVQLALFNISAMRTFAHVVTKECVKID